MLHKPNQKVKSGNDLRPIPCQLLVNICPSLWIKIVSDATKAAGFDKRRVNAITLADEFFRAEVLISRRADGVFIVAGRTGIYFVTRTKCECKAAEEKYTCWHFELVRMLNRYLDNYGFMLTAAERREQERLRNRSYLATTESAGAIYMEGFML